MLGHFKIPCYLKIQQMRTTARMMRASTPPPLTRAMWTESKHHHFKDTVVSAVSFFLIQVLRVIHNLGSDGRSSGMSASNISYTIFFFERTSKSKSKPIGQQ